jgi:hypothetical protein
MMLVLETLLPVFLLIGLGFVLVRAGWVPTESWRGVEQLGYFVLFPALLAQTLITSDIRSLPLSGMAVTIVGAFLAVALGLLAFQTLLMNWLGMNGPAFSSLFQSATRWNSFIALPILAKLEGPQGVALVAVIMAALVPVANVFAVMVVSRNAAGAKPSLWNTLRAVARNPFIIAIAAGLLINFLRIPVYPPVLTTLSMLGTASIPTGLLVVGAGLAGTSLKHMAPAVWASAGLKLLATPALALLIGLSLGVSGPALMACLVCAGVPTAMSSYVLARQMGGDAPLVASALTVQTVASFFTLPLVIVAGRACGG